jgi:hypothetical protein
MGLELYISWSLYCTYATESGAVSTAKVIFGRISREGNDWCTGMDLELGGMFEGNISEFTWTDCSKPQKNLT